MAYYDEDNPPMDDATYDFLMSEPASDPEFEDTIPKAIVAVAAVTGCEEQILVSRHILPNEKETRIEIPVRMIPCWAVNLEIRVVR